MKTIKIPGTSMANSQNSFDATGNVYKIKIGNQTQKFLVHPVKNIKTLTHFKSGRRVGTLNSANYLSENLKERQRAVELIDSLVEKHGTDRVNVVMDSALVIN